MRHRFCHFFYPEVERKGSFQFKLEKERTAKCKFNIFFLFVLPTKAGIRQMYAMVCWLLSTSCSQSHNRMNKVWKPRIRSNNGTVRLSFEALIRYFWHARCRLRASTTSLCFVYISQRLLLTGCHHLNSAITLSRKCFFIACKELLQAAINANTCTTSPKCYVLLSFPIHSNFKCYHYYVNYITRCLLVLRGFLLWSLFCFQFEAAQFLWSICCFQNSLRKFECAVCCKHETHLYFSQPAEFVLTWRESLTCRREERSAETHVQIFIVIPKSSIKNPVQTWKIVPRNFCTYNFHITCFCVSFAQVYSPDTTVI